MYSIYSASTSTLRTDLSPHNVIKFEKTNRKKKNLCGAFSFLSQHFKVLGTEIGAHHLVQVREQYGSHFLKVPNALPHTYVQCIV